MVTVHTAGWRAGGDPKTEGWKPPRYGLQEWCAWQRLLQLPLAYITRRILENGS